MASDGRRLDTVAFRKPQLMSTAIERRMVMRGWHHVQCPGDLVRGPQIILISKADQPGLCVEFCDHGHVVCRKTPLGANAQCDAFGMVAGEVFQNLDAVVVRAVIAANKVPVPMRLSGNAGQLRRQEGRAIVDAHQDRDPWRSGYDRLAFHG